MANNNFSLRFTQVMLGVITLQLQPSTMVHNKERIACALGEKIICVKSTNVVFRCTTHEKSKKYTSMI